MERKDGLENWLLRVPRPLLGFLYQRTKSVNFKPAPQNESMFITYFNAPDFGGTQGKPACTASKLKSIAQTLLVLTSCLQMYDRAQYERVPQEIVLKIF